MVITASCVGLIASVVVFAWSFVSGFPIWVSVGHAYLAGASAALGTIVGVVVRDEIIRPSGSN